jgi:organic radical activating enzyme
MLVEIGYFVQIETNGTFNPPEDIEYSCATDERKGVYIVCSPKAGKVRTMIHECACCYKYVGSAGNLDKDDGLPIWPLEHPSNGRVARPENEMIPVYLQPTDHKDPVKNLANREAVILSCLKHGYILQLQVHKIIDME